VTRIVELFYTLLVLLIATRIFGEAARRLRQPQLVGELVAGILIGIAAQRFSAQLPTLAGLPDDEVFHSITDLAVFFLMLLAGVEMRPRDLARRSGIALPVAVGGIVLPLSFGVGIAWLWLPASDALLSQALILGLSLAITAVPVSVSVLLELGELKTKIGGVIVGAAVFDDILSLILLAIVMSIAVHQEPLSALAVGGLLGQVLLFFGIAVFAGHVLLPRAGGLIKHFKLEHVELSLLIIWALLLAVLAERLELHFAVGAFAAGLLFRRRSIDDASYEDIRDRIEAVTVGFLAPLFFASIGLRLRAEALIEIPLLVAVVVAAAFVGKFAGAGLVARAAGLNAREALAVGAGMNARGAVALIVADIALRAGVFDRAGVSSVEVSHLFSAIVVMAIATTIVSPMLLRYALSTASSRT
jgi:Kef-type K+ transport system membrane component KefB